MLNLIHLSCRWSGVCLFLISFNKRDNILTGLNTKSAKMIVECVILDAILTVKIVWLEKLFVRVTAFRFL